LILPVPSLTRENQELLFPQPTVTTLVFCYGTVFRIELKAHSLITTNSLWR